MAKAAAHDRGGGGVDRQRDGPIRLLAQRAVMMMMTMMTIS